MDNIYFCTFTSTDMKTALYRIGSQAKNFGIFKKIYLYTEKRLPSYAQKRIKNIISITNSRRGYAYWAWKPVLINDVLKKMNNGDILVYSDAGSHLNKNGLKKFFEYVELAKQNDIWLTHLWDEFTDQRWTKQDTIEYFRSKISDSELLKAFDEKITNGGQLQGGTIILIKNDYTISLMKQWESLMTIENLHLFDDSPSVVKELPEFKENRHDQSILSLLLKSNHYTSTPVTCFWGESQKEWNDLITSSPFLHLRDIESENTTTRAIKFAKRIVKKILRIQRH